MSEKPIVIIRLETIFKDHLSYAKKRAEQDTDGRWVFTFRHNSDVAFDRVINGLVGGVNIVEKLADKKRKGPDTYALNLETLEILLSQPAARDYFWDRLKQYAPKTELLGGKNPDPDAERIAKLAKGLRSIRQEDGGTGTGTGNGKSG